jgi:hypothetical protein
MREPVEIEEDRVKREKMTASIEGYFIGHAIGAELQHKNKDEITNESVKDAMDI